MIDLVLKFVSWITDAVTFIATFNIRLTKFLVQFTQVLSVLPNGMGVIIVGMVTFVVSVSIAYAIAKLVSSLL